MPRKTYLDTGVLISAYRGDEDTSSRAMSIIADEERTFVVSDILALECISPPAREGHQGQVDFCQEFFARSEHASVGDAITRWAVDVLSRHCISPMDLLHVAIAVESKVDDFVTTEATTKPFFTIGAPLNVVSIL